MARTTEAPPPAGRGRPGHWSLRYPPVAVLGIALIVVLAILPSALNLPQSNPTTTPEFAPIPPDDAGAPPPGGNLSSLGLASSRGLSSDPSSGSDVVRRGRAAGKSPVTKECVGNPPRQSEDPLSPPCVAHFEGDNGGATYTGVSRDEVRLLFTFDSNTVIAGSDTGSETSCANSQPPCFPVNQYFDLSQPPQGQEDVFRRVLRVWQAYFNKRYQTYDRRVVFWVYYGSNSGGAVEQRTAQAAEAFEKVRPFALSQNFVFCCSQGRYEEELAKKGVMIFGSARYRAAEFYQRFGGLSWGYLPSAEQQSLQFSSYVCKKVAPYNVSFSGNDRFRDQPRVYGVIEQQGQTAYRGLVERQLSSCGITYKARAVFPRSTLAYSGEPYAQTQMADFSNKGITTIIWPFGYENEFSKAAGTLSYYPEWVISGNGLQEGQVNARAQDQNVWSHAWVVSDMTLLKPSHTGGASQACHDAWNAIKPGNEGADRLQACSFYDRIRQEFTGIQVAGPRLTPSSVERGFRAIPPYLSNSNDVPACYYEPGDYTCVKDATVMRWDPTADTSTGAGCYRMSENGKRYSGGRWPDGPVEAQSRPNDVCQYHSGGGAVG